MSEYKLLSGGGVLHVPTGSSIPPDPANRHWRAFLAWQQAGGVADPADPETTIAQLWTVMRRERDARLAATDQWGLVDYRNQHDAATVAAWDTYRQALRNLPDNTTDPRYVSWPTKPS